MSAHFYFAIFRVLCYFVVKRRLAFQLRKVMHVFL